MRIICSTKRLRKKRKGGRYLKERMRTEDGVHVSSKEERKEVWNCNFESFMKENTVREAIVMSMHGLEARVFVCRE